MRSILEITDAAARPRFTTLSRVKSELEIEGDDSNDVLTAKIEEASSDIQLALGYRVPHEANVETFRHDDPNELRHYRATCMSGTVDYLFLRRKKVVSITSVVLDDDTLDPSEYALDGDLDALIRLDTSGYPCPWLFCRSIVVSYDAGYILPGASGADLLPTIESAVVDLVSEYWASKGQNPLVKSENIPGLAQYDYWVGATGDPEQLPPRVLAKLALAKRPRLAVA
jgi:hypothetical protein